jgi:beta-mannosidase
MRPDKQFWSTPEYWDGKEIPIFNSEYGYGGPCSIETTRQYLGSDQPDLFNETGRQHTNTFYDIPRVNWSIQQHYRETDKLSLKDYILLGGLCQGLNLGYSLESLRANEQSMGGIFWMYDDSWGENGWTIIDYYLRRKVSYYNVKRCLAPRRLVLRRGGQAFGGTADEVLLIALNDAAESVECSAQLGYASRTRQGHRRSRDCARRGASGVRNDCRHSRGRLRTGELAPLPLPPSRHPKG